MCAVICRSASARGDQRRSPLTLENANSFANHIRVENPRQIPTLGIVWGYFFEFDKDAIRIYNTRTHIGMEVRVMKQCMDAENLHRRLKKIIGQVQAIDRMVDEDIPCEDILSQINAAKSALNKVGKVVLEGHINHCVRVALEKGDNPDKTIADFTKAVERFANMQ